MVYQAMLSSGIIPVRREGTKTLYLLLRVFGYWDFPKGLVEPGEDPWTAAQRELREETGIARIQKRLSEGYFETQPYSRGKVARYYLAEVENERVELPVNAELGRAEHHEFRWVTLSQARELLVPRVRAALEWANQEMGG